MQSECDDKNCPLHGKLSVRKREFAGTVVSAKATKTVVVQWIKAKKLSKYNIYMKERKRVLAHNPPCINAKEGDEVVIKECRPISKWKKFVITKVIKHGNRA
ncbi:MAG: 30S ribosomal protein S17 [Candidatus Rehaiarchaeum fermentans]|nr:30S ribosomal protein S17 [Candidatus Rehaiarchaeum fermentans]